jgi:hypothetical protein
MSLFVSENWGDARELIVRCMTLVLPASRVCENQIIGHISFDISHVVIGSNLENNFELMRPNWVFQ